MKLTERAMKAEPFHAMAIGQQAAELGDDGHDVIRLCLGEPDFGAPPAVRDAMRDVMDGRTLNYTAALGMPELRQAIADFYRTRHDVDVDPAQIVITNGASSALLLVTAATIEAGDDVLLADPSYPCNRQLIETFGGRVVYVPTSAQSRFQLDAAAVAEAWTGRTTAVMAATPSNPTGTSIPFHELAEICDLARDRDAWRIVDEIYLELSDHGADGRAARTALSADREAIVINSFSKYFGMTGWRLGWAVVPEVVVPSLERLAMNYFLCASAPGQQAALAAFSPESLELCEQRRLELLERREIVVAGLGGIGLPVPVVPDGAFYVYFDVSGTGLDAWDFCEQALAEAHVALTPGRDFGIATADSHVRLSYAASRENLSEGLRRLGDFVADLPATVTG